MMIWFFVPKIVHYLKHTEDVTDHSDLPSGLWSFMLTDRNTLFPWQIQFWIGYLPNLISSVYSSFPALLFLEMIPSLLVNKDRAVIVSVF